jgi:hypothetical protein
VLRSHRSGFDQYAGIGRLPSRMNWMWRFAGSAAAAVYRAR